MSPKWTILPPFRTPISAFRLQYCPPQCVFPAIRAKTNPPNTTIEAPNNTILSNISQQTTRSQSQNNRFRLSALLRSPHRSRLSQINNSQIPKHKPTDGTIRQLLQITRNTLKNSPCLGLKFTPNKGESRVCRFRMPADLLSWSHRQ